MSAADIRLIALAHTLQLARHGQATLKPLPVLPSVRKGNAPAAKELPGWNESGDKWADMDKLTEENLAEQELAGAALTLPTPAWFAAGHKSPCLTSMLPATDLADMSSWRIQYLCHQRCMAFASAQQYTLGKLCIVIGANSGC